MLNDSYRTATTVMELAAVAAREHTTGAQRRVTSSDAYLLLKGLTDGMELISQLTPQAPKWTDEQKYLYGSFSRTATELAQGLTAILDITSRNQGVNRGN